MKVLVAFIGIVILSGCLSPEALDQSPNGITLSRKGISGKEAVFSEANIHCQKYKKYAQLTFIRVNTYTFECR
jgi:hypothetical protein